MTSSNLVLNCFPVEISPTTFDFVSVEYSSNTDATTGLQNQYAGFLAQRHDLGDGKVQVILLNGPEEPQDAEFSTFDVGEFYTLGAKLIDRAIADHLIARGIRISRDKSTTKAVMKAPAFSKGLVDIFNGIEFQVKRPFNDLPYNFVLSVQWKVTVLFNDSLLNPMLRDIARGMPVLYKPDIPHNEVPLDLRPFRYRYLGHLHTLETQDKAIVNCKDGELRSVSLSSLFLEGSPAVIREYESKAGMRNPNQSIWHKIQELEFALNHSGRRNSSVLKDRLQAIRKLLGSGLKEQLVLPLSCFRAGSISLGLSPLRVEVK
jgi:hypothetical protein